MNGGMIYASGATSSSITAATSLSVKQAFAYSKGGMIYTAGAGASTITLNSLTAKYLQTGPTGNGAGLYIDNQNGATIQFLTANILSSVSGGDGGFIYRNSATSSSYALTLNTVTINQIYSNTGNGGFAYLNAAAASTITLIGCTISSTFAPKDGGFIYTGGAGSVTITLPTTASTFTNTTANVNGGTFSFN